MRGRLSQARGSDIGPLTAEVAAARGPSPSLSARIGSLEAMARRVLTVGTDFGFMFPPWILKNEPTAGKGFEAAMAYEVAEVERLRSENATLLSKNQEYEKHAGQLQAKVEGLSRCRERDGVCRRRRGRSACYDGWPAQCDARRSACRPGRTGVRVVGLR